MYINIIRELEQIICELEQIIETGTRQLRNQSIIEYLIKCKNLPVADSTWEDDAFIRMHPKLHKH